MKNGAGRLTLLCSLLLSSLNFASSTPGTDIIIELADTGSALHIFQYPTEGTLQEIKEIFSRKNELPIEIFQDSPAKASLKSLITAAQQKLHEWHIENPGNIEVIGLSHMQLLPPTTVKAIYDNIKHEIEMLFPQVPVQIHSISGKQQALFGWLEVNYQLKRFEKGKSTVGTINISNASTDISFARPQSEKTIDEVSIKINNQLYTVFTKSYLGLGVKEARNFLQTDDSVTSCYPTGHFNLIECKNAYDKIIQHYSMEFPAYKIKKFYTISNNIFQTYRFFDIKKALDQETIEQEYINKVCHNSWETLKAAYPATQESELLNVCSDGVFITQLLFNTLQLQPQQLKFADTIHGHPINWARGALLYKIITG